MTLPWHSDISNFEQKQKVALDVAGRLNDGDTVGVGSGSTAFLALQAMAKRVQQEKLNCAFITTSKEMELTSIHLGLNVLTLQARDPDWCFDGADEVDLAGNMIKGRGGAMYQEKLVMQRCQKRIILIDESKKVQALGKKFAIPIELDANALRVVQSVLMDMGAGDVTIRTGQGKDGPIYTENGNVILDALFLDIDANLEKELKSITAVVETGLFWGYEPEILCV